MDIFKNSEQAVPAESLDLDREANQFSDIQSQLNPAFKKDIEQQERIDEQQKHIEDLQKKVDEQREKIDEQQKKIDEQREKIDEQQKKIDEQQKRIDKLEKQVGGNNGKPNEPYSMSAEEKRRKNRAKKKRRRQQKNRAGRTATAHKLKNASRIENVFPEGVSPDQCRLSHSRVIWRLEGGKAVLVGYNVFRGPGNKYGKISGSLGRSEFGLEIIIAISFQIHVMGLSFDKVCVMFRFFNNLVIRKSQAEALMRQLARHWEKEFDNLCVLLANSAVVHADETSWSLNSVWALLSEHARLVLFGVHKDKATLEQFLDPRFFCGLVISDDAAVYSKFTLSQKCWAHLLRKAIKLALENPSIQEYRDFTDKLWEIYARARRIQSDKRLSDNGRALKILELESDLETLCHPMRSRNPEEQKGYADAYRRLVNELIELKLKKQLFTFVTTSPVAQPNGKVVPITGTNNEAERTLRNPAQARKTGRTNKTPRGARRQTVLGSVLESLRLYLSEFTIQAVLSEITRWAQNGKSCFEELREKLGIPPPSESVLDKIIIESGG